MDSARDDGEQRTDPVHVQPLRRPQLEPPPPRGGGHGWVWLVVLCGVAVAGYFLAWPYVKQHLPQRNAPATQPAGGRSIPVVAATAHEGEMKLYLNGLGTVVPLNTVTVKSRVDGQIMKIYFEEGQSVKEGDPLVDIDPRPFEVQLALAEGQMTRDQALLKNAQLDLQRYQTAKESVTQQQVDTQQALVGQYQGAVKSDQAQIDNAKLQISYCHITAPLSGRIGLRMVDRGNIVRSTDLAGLAVITQIQPIAVVFSLPEDAIPRVMGKMNSGPPLPVEVYDRDLRSQIASGLLRAIDSQIDPTTGTVRFKAIFPNSDNHLFPNQFVNVRLLIETRERATIVPAAAIQRSPRGTFVYVVKPDQTVDMQDVKVGPTEGDDSIVEEGLHAGQVVVTDGVDKLQKGTKVTLGRGGPATRPGAATRPGGPATRPDGASPLPETSGGRKGRR